VTQSQIDGFAHAWIVRPQHANVRHGPASPHCSFVRHIATWVSTKQLA
jgi:hypothetical protein